MPGSALNMIIWYGKAKACRIRPTYDKLKWDIITQVEKERKKTNPKKIGQTDNVAPAELRSKILSRLQKRLGTLLGLDHFMSNDSIYVLTFKGRRF